MNTFWEVRLPFPFVPSATWAKAGRTNNLSLLSVVEGSLNDLLDRDGGISKRKVRSYHCLYFYESFYGVIVFRIQVPCARYKTTQLCVAQCYESF
jgi:hypothetical protein